MLIESADFYDIINATYSSHIQTKSFLSFWADFVRGRNFWWMKKPTVFMVNQNSAFRQSGAILCGAKKLSEIINEATSKFK